MGVGPPSSEEGGGGYVGFATGRGKKVEISDEARRKAALRCPEAAASGAAAQGAWGGGSTEEVAPPGEEVPCVGNEPNQVMRQEEEPSFVGFSSGKGVAVVISEEARRKAALVFGDADEGEAQGGSISFAAGGAGVGLGVGGSEAAPKP